VVGRRLRSRFAVGMLTKWLASPARLGRRFRILEAEVCFSTTLSRDLGQEGHMTSWAYLQVLFGIDVLSISQFTKPPHSKSYPPTVRRARKVDGW
jgi:hypothetical protein